jgi:hypothetical protein
MKPNLGLFIGSEFHARSLTESKVFNLLVENYELKIFATSNICKYFEQIDLPFEIIEILNNVLPNILLITKRILNLSLGIFFAPIFAKLTVLRVCRSIQVQHFCSKTA